MWNRAQCEAALRELLEAVCADCPDDGVVSVAVAGRAGGAEIAVTARHLRVARSLRAVPPGHEVSLARGAELPRGWGVALTLVSGCAEIHAGSLDISYSPDAGSSFLVRLPYDAREGRGGDDAERGGSALFRDWSGRS